MSYLDFMSLIKHFTLPLNEAALKIGIGTTKAKRICRENGIMKWPWRKVASLEKIISELPDGTKEQIFVKEVYNKVVNKQSSALDMVKYMESMWPLITKIRRDTLNARRYLKKKGTRRVRECGSLFMGNVCIRDLDDKFGWDHETCAKEANEAIDFLHTSPFEYVHEEENKATTPSSLQAILAKERERLRMVLGG